MENNFGQKDIFIDEVGFAKTESQDYDPRANNGDQNANRAEAVVWTSSSTSMASGSKKPYAKRSLRELRAQQPSSGRKRRYTPTSFKTKRQQANGTTLAELVSYLRAHWQSNQT